MIRTRHARARKRATRKTRRPGEMNKAEAEFALVLEAKRQAGNIQSYRFEQMQLICAHEPRVAYSPDFLVIEADGAVTFYEVKAMWKLKAGGERIGFEEDARTKLRTAAGIFSEFRFVVAAKSKLGKGWMYEEISKP